MEESPHKCPVCSRSFNQRSNLKTHLLTHTDHKPYECSSCGKVFRRNCDLRRHALTHAVGDVPPSDSSLLDGDDDDRPGTELSEDEDDDTVLEVGSPDHSPVRRTSSSPSMGYDLTTKPVNRTFQRQLLGKAVVEKEVGDVGEKLMKKAGAEDSKKQENTGNKESGIEKPDSESNSNSSIVEVTHCHVEGSDGGHHYTMRPHFEYHSSPLSLISGHHRLIHKAVLSSKAASDNFVPMLHVRRDLHHKSPLIGPPVAQSSSTSTSNNCLLDPGPSFLGSIPIRKRPMGLDGEPQVLLPLSSSTSLSSSSNASLSPLFLPNHSSIHGQHISALHHNIPPPHHPFNLHHSPSSSSSTSSPSPQTNVKIKSAVNSGRSDNYLNPAIPSTSGTVKASSSLAAPQQVQPSKPTPKKTGFSIEDIMRR